MMPQAAVTAVDAAQIQAARGRLDGLVRRTPVVRHRDGALPCELYLKLECQQEVGSFKVRPVGSALLAREPATLRQGVYTCSSGNSAVALAAVAARLGLAATAVVPPEAPQAKLARLAALGARIRPLPASAWWQAVEARGVADEPGVYIDAVRDPAALAGNAALGVEILEQVGDLDAIFTPFGGGALACGIACAMRALGRPVRVIACELDSAQPLSAARRNGEPIRTAAASGFVSGVGFHSLLPEMWPLCRDYLAGTLTVSLPEVAAAIRMLSAAHGVTAEGAGAIPVAAALFRSHGFRRVCAVVSGGNIDHEVLATILRGDLP
ncbi:MAG: pyridoxal-phosphate dependent enzyme [Proteobacteria bacterium]|nr:pyridoxal-phosphate dependent enzyme [Pseudomonadota bacterium]